MSARKASKSAQPPAVAPVVLDVAARQPVVTEGGVLVRGMEVDVRGRQAKGRRVIDDGIEQRAPRDIVARQQARAGDGRVGHRAQPLGVVVQPVLRMGMRPGVVEHELAVGVVFQVARRRGDQRVALPQRQVPRRPAPLRAQAAVPLQPLQERMCDEGVRTVVQPVPGRRGNLRQRIVGMCMKRSSGHGLTRIQANQDDGQARGNASSCSRCPRSSSWIRGGDQLSLSRKRSASSAARYSASSTAVLPPPTTQTTWLR